MPLVRVIEPLSLRYSMPILARLTWPINLLARLKRKSSSVSFPNGANLAGPAVLTITSTFSDGLEDVSYGVGVGEVGFELALTIADLEDFIFGQKLGDDSSTYGAGGAEDDDLFIISNGCVTGHLSIVYRLSTLSNPSDNQR